MRASLHVAVVDTFALLVAVVDTFALPVGVVLVGAVHIGCEGIFALIVDVLLFTTHVPQHVGVVSCGFVDPAV